MEEVNDQIKQSVSLISAFRFPSANKHCNHSPSGQIQEVDCIVFVIIYLKSMKGKTNSKFTPQIFFSYSFTCDLFCKDTTIFYMMLCRPLAS